MNHNNLDQIIKKILGLAKYAGATSAEVDIGTGNGLTVTARMGEVETIEHQRDKGLSLTVYIDKKKGNASTSDFSDPALESTIEAAVAIARHANEDPYAGLIEQEYLATDIPDLDLHHPWDINPEQAVELAIRCEQEARQQDKRICNSEGASINSYSGQHAYGNSLGFIGGWEWSSHSIDCALIAEENGAMQRDGWHSRGRDYRDLESVESIAHEAARRTVAKLSSRKLSTRSVPVIYEAPAASSLFSSFIGAISGGALYRKSSFLLDKKSEQIFPEQIQIREEPHIKKGVASAPFDNEGMATQPRYIVKDGVLQDYVLSAYSARKLGLKPTGNAGGVHNLIIQPGEQDFETLLKQMNTGLLITDLIGFGINQVTGDYSRGASGFWIENGEIQYPVEEITVAGNLADMYQHIVTIANDVDKRGNIQTGSVLIENMMIAGE